MRLQSLREEPRDRQESDAPVGAPLSHPVMLDDDKIERAAKALFDFVFSHVNRLDGKHEWVNCDEDTKQGFRREVMAVILSVWPTR
jgi:hypothetical protein